MKREQIEQLLPGVFQRTAKPGTPLRALLDAMETLQAPAEDVLSRLDEFFDPRRTRDDFVPVLARWVDLDFLLETRGGDKLNSRSSQTISTGLGRLRELVASAAELAKWTGTAHGLLLFLKIATGEEHFEIRENIDAEGKPHPFHLTVIAPASMKPHLELIQRIITSEKPAYVTCSQVTFKTT